MGDEQTPAEGHGTGWSGDDEHRNPLDVHALFGDDLPKLVLGLLAFALVVGPAFFLLGWLDRDGGDAPTPAQPTAVCDAWSALREDREGGRLPRDEQIQRMAEIRVLAGQAEFHERTFDSLYHELDQDLLRAETVERADRHCDSIGE